MSEPWTEEGQRAGATAERLANPPALPETSFMMRWFLIGLGWAFVAVAFVGVFLPVLPTTPFVLLALWCFARSSRRFHDWLYNHPRLGALARAWRDHGVIPPRAKLLSVTMMTLSLAYVFHVAPDWRIPAGVGAVLVAVAIWIVTRPSRPPLAADGGNT